MRVTQEEFDREWRYLVIMFFVGKMLRQGLITEEEYREIGEKNRQKYCPVIGGLLSEKNLIYRQSRANMGTGKEA